jgi:long-chain acyl-CoA synthetase
VDADTRLDELGLSSLDRVDLIASLDERHGVAIDEVTLLTARTVGDLRDLTLRQPAASTPAPMRFPTWGRSWPARAFRALFQAMVVMPAIRRIARIDAGGLDRLALVRPPVLFAANHQSHLDTAVILAALPSRWRRRLATAMAREYFAPHFHPADHPLGRRWFNRLLYGLAVAVFHGFPLPQREPGTRETMRQVGALVDAGWSILIYPEGRRYQDGEIGTFQAGVGMLAERLRLPVLPIWIAGTGRVMPPGPLGIRPGPVRLRMGLPMMPNEGEGASAFARRVESEIRTLSES